MSSSHSFFASLLPQKAPCPSPLRLSISLGQSLYFGEGTLSKSCSQEAYQWRSGIQPMSKKHSHHLLSDRHGSRYFHMHKTSPLTFHSIFTGYYWSYLGEYRHASNRVKCSLNHNCPCSFGNSRSFLELMPVCPFPLNSFCTCIPGSQELLLHR